MRALARRSWTRGNGLIYSFDRGIAGVAGIERRESVED